MNISLITPAGKRSLNGNRATAVRWAGLLGDLGHRVSICECWEGTGNPDLMVAIHAYRSAASILRFRKTFPGRPLVVLMAGTDIYRFQHSHPRETGAAMAAADRLVGLHDDVAADLPTEHRDRVIVIHQSARPLPRGRQPSRRHFEICVVAHLREEKDPLRAALAARRLPDSSRLRVVLLGKAHDDRWAEAAEAEAAANRRFVWRGEAPLWRVRRQFARSHAMVISSVMEGGANVVSEAVVAGVPVIASDIAGNTGLLGAGHPALFPARDTAALTRLLTRAESEPGFLTAVARSGESRRALFTADRERAAWKALLDDLTGAA